MNESKMPSVMSLDSTLIVADRSAVAKSKEYLITMDDFADSDRSFSIADKTVADALRTFALQEMATIKLAVGDPKSTVEFFSLDLKDAKAVAKLDKLCSLVWLRAKQEVEVVRESSEDFFSDVLTNPIDAVVDAAELRRFLVNATNKKMMTKTKRTILLFHHTEANAPKEE